MSRFRRVTASRRRGAAVAAGLKIGQYQGWDQSAAISTWETTNNITIPYGHEFGDNTYWTYFENGTNFANWETWVNAKAGRRFTYSAPLLTASDDTGLTRAQKFANLAAGTYDSHFTNLGNAFQARPALRNSIVRLGWEFNGSSWPWSVPPNDQTTLDNYKTGFNKAAAALKAACPTLQIEWCPNCQLDYTQRLFADMYPGDTYIDYIGIGLYDYYWPGGTPTQAQREAWLRDNPNGLADQVALAASRGKPLAHTEWGLWTLGNTGGGGDRPEFIDFIADWYAANGYAYSIYNNVSASAEHRLDTYPLSKARYLARFGTPVTPTAPTVGAGVDATATTGTAFTRTATESANGATITARTWTILSGPAGVGTTIGTTAALSWTPTTVGSYVLRYSATNSAGTGTDDVAITVGAQAASNPANIASLKTRWVASDLALANAAAITNWAPRTGTGTLTQATTNAKPTYRTAGNSLVGSQAAVRFDGTNDVMTTNMGTAPGPDQTLVMILKQARYNVLEELLQAGSVELLGMSTGNLQLYAGTALNASATPQTGPTVVVATVTSGTTDTLHINGTQVASGAAGNPITANDIRVGGYSGGGRFLSADVAEILVFNTALTAGDRAIVDSYAQNTYGITVSDYLGS